MDESVVRKLFTEVRNEVRSRVIFSLAYIQSDLFLEPAESPSNGHKRECRFKALLYRHRF